MLVRTAHRARWTVVWGLLLLWSASLILDIGGGLANLALILAIVVLFYELLAVDRGA